MVSISDLEKNLEPAVGKFSKQLQGEFRRQLVQIFRREVGPALKKRFLTAYDLLAREEAAETGFAVSGEDPTRLEANRYLFENQLDREIEAIKIVDDELVINLMNRKDLGFGEKEARHGAPKTVDWLHFYIEGLSGQFAFISLEQYELKKDKDARKLGRFNEGFLIDKKTYKAERWQEMTGLSFEDVKHPISGQKPYKEFEKIAANFDFGQYVRRALERAVKNTS